MSVDLSSLNLKKLDPTNWDDYPVGGSAGTPHDPGVYSIRATKFEYTAKDGFLTATGFFTIEDAEEGKDAELRDYLSTKPITKGRRKGACKAGDYLKAVGSEQKPGTDPQEWADAIEETIGAIVQVQIDWSCYDSESQKELAGTYSEFPVDPNDNTRRLPYLTVKDAKTGEEKRFRARQRVRFYVTPK